MAATSVKKASAEVRYAVDVASSVATGSPGEVDSLISANPVVLFSKLNCPFCIELKRTLRSLGVSYAVVEVDRHPMSAALRASLIAKSGVKTLPVLYVDGKCQGGCESVKGLEAKNALSFLAPFMTVDPAKEAAADRLRTAAPLFWFPHTINNHGARFSGLLTVIYCVLCIAFYDKPATPWAVLALAIDFTIRLLWGNAPSIIGMVAVLLASPFQPVFKAGAPKQFAAFCGVFFSVFAAGLYLSGYIVGGAVVLGGLMGAAALESGLDFCLGCWMYGYLIDFGIVSPNIYRSSLNLKGDMAWAWKFANADSTVYPRAVNEHVLLPGQTEPTEVDLIRKQRLETEYKNKDWDMIRHTRVDSFAPPMSIAALAFAYSLVGALLNDTVASRAGDVLGITAAVIFCFVLALQLCKLAMYPKKMVKEWNHPTFGNLFSAVSICLSLFGLIMRLYQNNNTASNQFALVLIWGGAIFQMVLSVIVVARLVFEHQSDEVINASIMMAPVGNFVSAIALASGPTNNPNVNYTVVSRLWFAVAALFAIVMFTITFKRAFADAHADVRLRPMLWIWQAAAAVAGPALYATSGASAPSVAAGTTYQSLWFIAMFFFVVNFAGWVRGFYTYCADMSIWVMAFSTAALAINTVQFYGVVTGASDTCMSVLTYFMLAFASTICAVCTVYTTMWTLDGSVFKPKQKWGPVSFMKLTHEAFRVAAPQLKEALEQASIASPNTLVYLLAQLEPFVVAYNAHAAHEEQVLFPEGRRTFPGLNPGMSEEHEHEHALLARVLASVAIIKAGLAGGSVDLAAALAALQGELPSLLDHLLAHMRNEEQTITVVLRKYVPIERQKELARRCFELTSSEDWHIIIPYVLNRLPHPVWKSRFVRTFLWAAPERVAELSLILYRGCDSAVYAALTDELPELVPRGAPGWQRKY